VIGLPNTTVTILGLSGGGTSVDPWGDPVELEQQEDILLTGIPAIITENHAVATTEADPNARVIAYFVARLPHGTTVDPSQRLRDEASGTVYVIDQVTQPPGLGWLPDLRVDMHLAT